MTVLLYIPLMKDLGMNWEDIKSTPRYELEGLLRALQIYNTIHAYDGYTDKDIGEMSKDRPQMRSDYSKSKLLKEKYEILMGVTKPRKLTSFKDLL